MPLVYSYGSLQFQKVSGTVFEVTTAELERIDAYEANDSFQRVSRPARLGPFRMGLCPLAIPQFTMLIHRT